MPVAHAGHWLVSLLYLAPVILIAGALVVQHLRDRQRARRSASVREASTPTVDDVLDRAGKRA